MAETPTGLTFNRRASGLKKTSAGIFCCLVVLVVSCTFLYSRYLTSLFPVENLAVTNNREPTQIMNLDDTLNFGARKGVETRTSWKAPIIWEGMFDPNLYDQKHIQNQTSVALTVFAVGRYLDAYLKTFLTSAEQHFMLGLKVIPVEKHSRWQDISMMRMKTISDAIESDIHHHCKYVFCFDVDQEFKGRFGSEALGDSVALLHAGYYKAPNNSYTYDRNPRSKAFMETGDYYYHAALFGGLLENVKNLTNYCFLNIMEDKLNNVEALWHDESHLNKYFWINKPSRLLSPEYCWEPSIQDKDIHVIRLIWAPKNYDRLRTG
ncbi:hypothetical protein JOQ06_022701 [Pogonophryne albipinna]|uniref:Alpha 1,3-galactosyltransferase 2 n=1 Tax=Pogonophryne albipinna TaxID=1090488 RepID=A0AAD6AAF4_9TELE|nr:hypothetical protein JOQ06_022701 [Pogonophryne albipinna]